jgi:hypothetical protein
VVLSPERSYALELGPGDLQGPPIIYRIQDLLLPGHSCALSQRAPMPTQAPSDLPLGQHHIRRVRRNGRKARLQPSAGLTWLLRALFTVIAAPTVEAIPLCQALVNTASFTLPSKSSRQMPSIARRG